MSDENKGGGETGSFIAFCIFLVVVTLYLAPAILVIFLFNGFDLEEAWARAFQGSLSFVICTFFWAAVLWRWATAKDRLR